jgi:hypothetical protein
MFEVQKKVSSNITSSSKKIEYFRRRLCFILVADKQTGRLVYRCTYNVILLKMGWTCSYIGINEYVYLIRKQILRMKSG